MDNFREKMMFTKNEKKTLTMLLENSRRTDSEIASKLRISSQAVGKIRRKLEKTIIKSYTLQLDYGKLGIQTFAIAIAKLTSKGMEMGELEIEQILLKNENIISSYRLPRGSSTHIILYGFTDINDFDNFFHLPKMKKGLHSYLEIKELYTFSHNSLIKDSPLQLYQKVIESLDAPKRKSAFSELERFKKRLK